MLRKYLSPRKGKTEKHVSLWWQSDETCVRMALICSYFRIRLYPWRYGDETFKPRQPELSLRLPSHFGSSVWSNLNHDLLGLHFFFDLLGVNSTKGLVR